MGRWSPTVVAEAPRNAGMGAAMFGQAAMGAYSDMEAMRDRRRQRELQAEEQAQQQAYRTSSLANDAERLRIAREDAKARQLNDQAEFRLKVAQAGGEEVNDGAAPTGNAQAGSPVINAQAAQQESDLQRVQREAQEMYPVAPSRITDPTSGTSYRLDANRAARDKFIQERLKEITEQTKGTLTHTRAMEIEKERTKRALDAARIRASQRGQGGGGGSSDDVSPTQMTAEINKMNTAFAGIQRRRGAIMKSPQNNPGSNAYNEEIAQGIWDQFRADSAATVDSYRPENNPRMAAAKQNYGIPQTATPFFDTGAIAERDAQSVMARLTMARDRAKNPAQRAQADKLLREYAQQVNQRGMQR